MAATLPSSQVALAGVVRLPAALVSRLLSDNGGNVIANNGATIIANNGGAALAAGGALIGKVKFGLAAAEEALPAPGVRVVLRDAAGAPLRGPDGAELAAVTGADGRFAFPRPLPDGALVLAVPLGPDGEALALAPAAGVRPAADVDRVSTLTAAYVLDRFVATQPDRAASLAKLPVDVEADTRAKAAAAVARAGGAATFNRVAAVAAVEALRRDDPALDAQLEAVRSLLIPAGQSNLGAGRVATAVAFGDLPHVVPAADGAVYLNAVADKRIWRLRTDGRIETAVGSGGAAGGDPAGQAGPQVGLGTVVGLALDADGRPVWAERLDGGRGRVSALAADGTVRVLWPDAPSPRALAVSGADVWLLESADEASATLWRRPLAGGAPIRLGDFKGAAAKALAVARRLAIAPGGTAFVETTDGQTGYSQTDHGQFGRIRQLDPAAGTALERPDLANANVALGPDGTVTAVDAAGKVVLVAPDGVRTPLLDANVPLLLRGDGDFTAGDAIVASARVAPDAALLVLATSASKHLVFRVGGDRLKHVAGQTGTEGGRAADTPLADPAGVAVGPDGTLYVVDRGAKQVRAIAADGNLTVLDLPPNSGLPYGFGPGILRCDSSGALYLTSTSNIVRFHPTGLLFGFAPGVDLMDGVLWDFVPAAGGTMTTMPEGAPAGLLPAGTQGPGALALGTDGTVWVAVDGRLRRWTKAGGGVAVDEDPRWTLGTDGAGAIAADGRGRILLARPATDTVERYDPATDAWEILAGKGGRKFTGDGVDDGLEAPGFPAIAPNGDLVFADRGHKQIKRIPAAEL